MIAHDISRRPRLLLAVLCLSLWGCWTSKQDGDAIRRDLDELKSRLSTDIERSRAEQAKLQKIMEQATALLTRNSADVGAQVDRLQTRLNKASGKVEEHERKLDVISQQLAKIEVKLDGLSSGAPQPKAPPVPEDKETLYKQATAALNAGRHEEARRLLRHFQSKFSDDSRATRAQLMLGDSYFAEQKFAPAIVEYKKIVEQHKKSAVFPDALYKIGMAFYQLKFCSDAQLFLSQLLKRYRRHAQASRAKKVLRLIKRYARNPQFCR